MPAKITPGASGPRIAALFFVLVLTGCPAGDGEGLDSNGRPLDETPAGDGMPPPAASLRQIQQEIFDPLCIVCHAGASAPVGLKLDAVNSFVNIVSVSSIEVPTLLRVAPGDPDNSYLVQKVEGTAAVGGRMPLGGSPVPADLIAALRQWIIDGALPDAPPSGQPVLPVVVAVVPESDSVLTTAPANITVVFNVAMDFSLLGDMTVRLSASGDDGLFDTGDDVMVTPAAISALNPQSMSIDLDGVTLGDDTYRLVLAGDGPLVLASLEGIVLDGDGDGEPGGDYESRFTLGTIPVEPLPDTSAPQVTLASPGSTLSGTVTVAVAAVDDTGVIQVTLLIDGQPFTSDAMAPFEFELDTTLLTDGSHVLGAEAVDAAGNTGVAAQIDILVDNAPPADAEPPQVVIVPPASPASGIVTVVVTATDNTGVTQVEFLVDGVSVAQASDPPFEFQLDTTLLTDGSHVLGAEAVDAAGNTGVASQIIILIDNTLPPDLEPPQVMIVAPVSPASGIVTVVVTATDNIGVTQVELFVDDVSVALTSDPPFELIWDTSAFPNGDRVLSAQATDAAGNTGVSVEVVVNVDNAPPPDVTAPEVAIAAPGGTLSGNTQITVDASDLVGVSRVRLLADGVLINELVAAPYQFAWDVSAVSDGAHILTAEADDDAGNTGRADPLVVTVANGTPQPTLPWLQDNIFSPTCTTQCHSAGGIGSFLLLTEGDSFAQLVNVATTESATPQFRVLPGDPDESALVQRLEGTLMPQMPFGGAPLSVDLIQAVRSWIAGGAAETPPDTIAPAVVVRLPAAPASGTVTLLAVAADDTAVVMVTFFVDGVALGNDTTAPYELAFDTTLVIDGDHEITAQAQDAAGNAGMSASETLPVLNN